MLLGDYARDIAGTRCTCAPDHDNHGSVCLPEPLDHLEHRVLLVSKRKRFACNATQSDAGIGALQTVPERSVYSQSPSNPFTVRDHDVPEGRILLRLAQELIEASGCGE